MEPIHIAARAGDLAEVNRLLAEDAGRLDARASEGSIPLMATAFEGHDAVVARLLALGADVGLRCNKGGSVLHFSCSRDHVSALALLLDAGASINARNNYGATPLMTAAYKGAVDCLALLRSRGGSLIELDATDANRHITALHAAVHSNHPAIIPLLLQAGADPSIRTNSGYTPLDLARIQNSADCIPLLERALAEPQRARLLLKARALLDTHAVIHKAAQDTRDDGLDYFAETRAVLAVIPTYLKRRVEQGHELPRVTVNVDQQRIEEKLVACVTYALGLAYGGGVHFEGEEKPVGMLPEVLVELCEMLVPKWARAEM